VMPFFILPLISSALRPTRFLSLLHPTFFFGYWTHDYFSLSLFPYIHCFARWLIIIILRVEQGKYTQPFCPSFGYVPTGWDLHFIILIVCAHGSCIRRIFFLSTFQN
jgi:hypothetical protein